MTKQMTTSRETSEQVAYVMRLPDDRRLFLELPKRLVSFDRDGSLLLKPAAVQFLDQLRAVAMRRMTPPSPAYVMTLRKALGLTMEAFGHEVGVDKMTVYRWENGTRRPSEASMAKINQLRDKRTGQRILLALPNERAVEQNLAKKEEHWWAKREGVRLVLLLDESN